MLKKTSIILALIIALIIFTAFILIQPYYLFLTQDLKISFFKTLISSDSLITYNNQVNILILGIAGGDHDGPNLTDSMMVANYNFKSNTLTYIS